jgi:HK97 gp10 family phage protein
MRTSVKVEGLRDLDQSLRKLAEDVSRGAAKAAMRRGVIRAGQLVVDAARAKVPVMSGKLRDSISVSTRVDNKAGKSAFAAVMKAGGSKEEAVSALRSALREDKGSKSTVEVYIGPSDRGTGKQLPYGQLVEFGSRPHVIRPKAAGKSMLFPVDGEFVGAREVSHPGVPPRPYMRPAWDQTQASVLVSIRECVADEVAKAVARAARKRAKAAGVKL